MVRRAGSNGVKTAAIVRDAGIRLIYQHGYEAMSLRELASEVGVQPGSLYKYFTNKEGLLFDIMKAHMDELLEQIQETLAPVAGPRERLLAFATFHLRYHRDRLRQLHIVNAELRCLGREPRAEIVAMRRIYEEILQDILADGSGAGVFNLKDIRISSFAIIAMLTGIGAWYRPDGRLELEEIVEIHLGLMMDGVLSSPAIAPRARASAVR